MIHDVFSQWEAYELFALKLLYVGNEPTKVMASTAVYRLAPRSDQMSTHMETSVCQSSCRVITRL